MRDFPASGHNQVEPALNLFFLCDIRVVLQIVKGYADNGLPCPPDFLGEVIEDVEARVSAARLELELGDAVRSEFARPSGDRQRSAAA